MQDHTGQHTGTSIQDQDEQQPEQEQTRYSAPDQTAGPGQMTGTEGYRTGYKAVHRYKSKVIA